MRLFVAVDVHSGILLATLDEFVESKSYVVCVLTPDARFLLVGEPSETRMFAVSPSPDDHLDDDEAAAAAATGDRRRQRPVARFAATRPPSALAVSADGRCAFVGQSHDCLFSVLDIDLDSSTFGQVSQPLYLTLSLITARV